LNFGDDYILANICPGHGNHIHFTDRRIGGSIGLCLEIGLVLGIGCDFLIDIGSGCRARCTTDQRPCRRPLQGPTLRGADNGAGAAADDGAGCGVRFLIGTGGPTASYEQASGQKGHAVKE
jgi:hypothetical protein